MPLSPSTKAVAGAVRVTVIVGARIEPAGLKRSTYCGRRNTPCASAPVRSASSISSAILAASPAGTPDLVMASTIRPRTAGSRNAWVVLASMAYFNSAAACWPRILALSASAIFKPRTCDTQSSMAMSYG